MPVSKVVKTSAIQNPSPDNTVMVQRQIKEAIETALRLRGDPNDSYVRVGELTALGQHTLVNDTLQVSPSANPGLLSPLSSKGDIWVWSNTNTRLPVGTNKQILTADSTQTAGLAWSNNPFQRGALWVNTTPSAPLTVPTNTVLIRLSRACTLSEIAVLGQGGTGSCVINIWSCPIATAYPPTSANDITGGANVSLVTQTNRVITTFTGWTTTFAAGDIVLLKLASTSIFTVLEVLMTFV